MRTYLTILLTGLFILLLTNCQAQRNKLKAGFDKAEYIELLKVSARQNDPAWESTVPLPAHFRKAYRSPVVGLDNRWDLWLSDDSIAVISIRGTTARTISWMENFYAAMVPATGVVKLADDFTFHYHLTNNPQAAVHIGWLIGMAHLSRDILPKIDSCYKQGIKQFIIMGHSQGAAIAYLLTSYLENQKTVKRLPEDIRIKTYCSAAPKPGNLYYAYDYEKLMGFGWGLTVVNTADWVPETPVSIQTLGDFNTTNPFINVSGVIKKQKFPKNIALRYAYNRLNNSTRSARRKYEKYLGRTVAKFLKHDLPGYQQPVYVNSFNYARCGQFTILQADTAYYKQFPDSKEKVFVHHGILPYLYLSMQLPDKP